MPLTGIGAAALSAGMGFLGNMFGSQMTAHYNAEEAQKNREFQEKMYNRQVEDNIKFWNMQNDYNLPSAQLQRLQDAGLNPLLMYGEGGISGNLAQQAPQSASAPHGAQAQTQFNTQIDLANLKLVEAQAKLLESQANKTDKESENIGEQTKGFEFMNWLNDQTSSVQVALRYRDYDRVNQLIAESREKVFNMQQYRIQDFRQLQFQNDMAIKRLNLDREQVGNNLYLGLEGLKIGRIQANAAMQSAAASWLKAKADWNLSNGQLALLREQASNVNWQNKWLKETFWNRVHAQSYINKQEYWKYQNMMMDNLLIESNIHNVDSQRWLRTYQADLMQSQSMFYNMQTFMAPVNALTGFGAPFQNAGNSFNGYQYTVTPGQ